MRDHSSIQEDLAELRLQFNTPITLRVLVRDFKSYIESLDNASIDEEELKGYLYKLIDVILESIDLGGITKEVLRIESMIHNLQKEKYINFKLFESGDYTEVNKVLIDIYEKWNDIQLIKEQCSDHISLIKKAIMYLSSLSRAISVFVHDEIAHGVKFKKLADSKRFIDSIVVDIDSNIDVLKSQITDLSGWIDNSIASKINMFMRAESSLRLLSKYAGWDNNYDSKFTGSHVG